MADLQRYWMRRAQWIAIAINGAWCIQWLLFASVPISGVLLVVTLVAPPAAPVGTMYRAFGAFVTFLALGLHFSNNKRVWFSNADALLLLDERLQLQSRLVAAAEGVVPWPEPRTAGSVIRLRPRSIVLALCTTALFGITTYLLATGALVANAMTHEGSHQELPRQLEHVRRMVEHLAASEVIAAPEIERLESAVDELIAQPSEEWFSQEGLEAADMLEQRLASAAAANLKQIENLSRALREQSLAPAAQSAAKRTIQALSQGALPLNQQLLDHLDNLVQAAPHNQLGAGHNAAVQQGPTRAEALNHARQTFAPLARGAAGLDRPMSPGPSQPNTTSPHGLAPSQDSPGAGISRGPGEAPRNLSERPPRVTSTARLALKSSPTKTQEPGEMVSMVPRRPVPIPQSESTLEGGNAAVQQESSVPVWRDMVAPEEEEVIANIFR